MMSLKAIREVNREMARRAEAETLHPSEVTTADVDDLLDAIRDGPRLPSIAWTFIAPEDVENLYPGQYNHLEVLFTDSLVLDPYNAEGPAHSLYSMLQRVRALAEEHGGGVYCSIHDAGQVELHVSVYALQ